jgi:hypothetical protein
MAESPYLRLGRALCAAIAKFTLNGLRRMIGHEANYQRRLQNYVFQTTGSDWRTVQAEIRQEFLTTFNLVYMQETGEPLAPQPTNARTEFLHAFAESAARSLQVGIHTLMI